MLVMPIQYAEIFVIVKEETYSNYVKSLIGLDVAFTNEDTIILSMSNGDVCDTREAKCMEILSGPIGGNSILPIYFKLESHTFHMCRINNVNGLNKMDFSQIFANNPKYVKREPDGSIYNVKYQTMEEGEVFSIVKLKSSKTPRFIMAYDDKWFDTETLMVVVNLLLKDRYRGF